MAGEKIRILLIEDNPGDARLIRELLSAKEGASFDLEHVDRLSTGLAQLAQGDIDVILLDLSLPDSHDLDGLGKILAQTLEVPIVVLSGLSDEAVAINAVQEGAQDYLVKGSVDSDSLVRSLHYAIERQHLRVALRESESRYRLLADNVADVIWTANMKWQITYVSPSITRLLGYTVEEMKRLAIKDILTPDSLKQAGKLIRNQLDIMTPGSQYSPLSLTLEHVRKDGSTLWAEVMLSFLWDRDGKLSEVLGVTREITERKKAEEALCESENQYRSLVDTASKAGLGITIVQNTKDEEAVFAFVNDEYCEISGYSREELLGRSSLDTIPPENLASIRERYERRQKGESLPSYYESTLLRKDGTRLPIETSVSVFTYRGKPATVSFFKDITERKKAEEALRESEEELKAIFDSSMNGIALLDLQGRLIRVNKRVLEVGGYDTEEISGKSLDLLKMFTPESIEQMASVRDMILSGKEVNAFECEVYTKSGTKMSLEINVGPFLLKGQLFGIVAVMRDITERKRAEEALRESEERYRELFENANDSIYTHDLAGNFTSINRAAEQVTGYRRDEVLGMNIARILTPESLEIARQMIAHKVSDGGQTRYELEIITKDGHRVLLEVNTRLIYEGGKPVGTQGIARDITERKKMEQELRRLSDAVKMSTDSIAITDLEGRIIEANEATLKMHGMNNREDLIGRLALELIAPEDHEMLTEKLAKGMAEGGPIYVEYHCVTKDGRKLLVEANVSVMKDRSGEPIGYMAVVRDITERKQMEEALRQSEQSYRVLLESTHDSIIVVDGETLKVVFGNRRAMLMFGFDPVLQDGVGVNLLDFIYPEYREIAIKGFAEDLYQRERRQRYDVRAKTQDGREIWISALGTRIEFQGRIAVLLSLRDVTKDKQMEAEKQKMEEQLRLAGRLAAVGELAAGVAHELNNPLTAIKGFAQLLTARKDLDETIRKDLDTIFRESQRAAKITQNLLFFARRHEPEKHPISINDVIENILEMQAHLMKVNNIELEVELAPDLPKTMADFHQMQQVFINIVNNAEQAMIEAHGKGRLLIKTQRSGKMVQITFADNGPGISEENLKRIFDPFFTTKEVGKGTGLGLSICYGLVEAHGGRIYARSKLGQGATFVVEMPIASKNQLVAEAALLNPGSRGVKWNQPEE